MAIVLVIVLLVRDREPQNPPDPEPTSVPVSQSSGVEMPSDPAARNGMFTEPPAMQIDPTKQYTAIFDTERGEITVQLYADKAPLTVNNFVFLTRSGFYDNTTFHRVIAGFMAQGGDPTGVGSGGPGYNFADEFDPTLRHDSAGILSMANTGSAGTNGSQFFLTFDATPWLDDVHTIFGKVTEGLDVLLSIQPRDPSTATEPGDLIRTIRIVEN